MSETFETWAIVELFGHVKMAGRVSEQVIAGAAMLRLDVPAADGQAGFTRFYGSSAVYSITPTDQLQCDVPGSPPVQWLNAYQFTVEGQACPCDIDGSGLRQLTHTPPDEKNSKGSYRNPSLRRGILEENR